jgi:hypothetical protein
MDRECMYKAPRLGTDLSFLGHVRTFVAAAKKHRLSLGQELMLCMCNSCKNNLAQQDNVCNLTWSGMVSSRITPSRSIMVRPIRVPLVHSKETRR